MWTPTTSSPSPQKVRPDHEEILDGTAQSERYGGILRDRSGRLDNFNSQEVANSQNFVKGNYRSTALYSSSPRNRSTSSSVCKAGALVPPPSCLGGGPDGWVLVDTHSTPVPSLTGEAVGGLSNFTSPMNHRNTRNSHRNDETELELSVKSKSFVNRVNDQVRKRQKNFPCYTRWRGTFYYLECLWP